MTTIIQQSSGTETRQIHIGAKLQSVRESMQLDRKDAAAQLRLNENVIDMIEKNSFPDTMPPIFVRGYIRSYGRLLQLSDDDILAALGPMKSQTVTQNPAPAAAPARPKKAASTESTNNHKYLIQGLTAGIALLLLWLVGAWWHARTSIPVPYHVTVSQLEEPAESAAPAGVSVQSARPAETIAAAPAVAAAPEVAAAAPVEPVKTIAEADTEDR